MLAVACLAGGIAFAFAKFARDPRFALEHVTVSGAARTGAEQVLAAAALVRGANVWFVDAGAAEQRIAALPWIATARVARRWPNAVSIALSERTPVAKLMTRGPDLALVDGEARVLQVGALLPADDRLPLLWLEPALRPVRAGERLESARLDGALEASQRLAALGVRISEISSEPASGISVTTESRLRVILGDDDELERKVAIFLAIAQHIARPDQVSYVDVRSTSAPTVQYRR